MKTKENNIIQKAILFFLILISILLIILVMEKSGIIESKQNINKKLLNNGEMLISEDGVMSKTVDSSNWDTNKVTAVTDADGNVVPVPKGYVGSNVTGENKVNDGYVIYEGTAEVNDSNFWDSQISRNQWVWVPVEKPNRIYEEVNGIKKAKLYDIGVAGRSIYENDNMEPAVLSKVDNTTNLENMGLIGMAPDKLYQELQKEFDSTIESIEKYGGFYIGRYETGNLYQSKPVVQRMNNDIADQNWYSMYSKAGYLAANENVKTNIIWGCLYDEVIEWTLESMALWTPDFTIKSNGWGNFLESQFNYVNTSWQTVLKQNGSAARIPAGSTEYTRYLNIFDFSGNVSEYTLECWGNKLRVCRSGCFEQSGYEVPAGIRAGLNPTEVSYSVGYRAYLYIK